MKEYTNFLFWLHPCHLAAHIWPQ